MKSTFVCQHCGKTAPRDPRIKKQKYCSLQDCQNARKRSFDRKTCLTIRDKSLKKVRNKRWRDTRPAHEYQKTYRYNHPDYVKRNREMQTVRNKKRQNAPSSMIVKTDAILLQPIHDGAYAGFMVKNGMIVKTDALMLQLQAHPSVKTFLRLNPG